jgi:S-adenosylmethionine:tRNA ribosyltransferase-isomerase
VRVENLAEHRMHPERFTVPAGLVAEIAATRAAGRRVVAVGTTVVRTLETAAALAAAVGSTELLQAGAGESTLFIRPGFRFRVVDAMLTNFHLPKSTLLVLVAAFAGREAVLAAYAHAVCQRYRFFSYGDAMLIAS